VRVLESGELAADLGVALGFASMGTLLGNLIGFVALIVSAVVALFSLEAAVFACIAHLAFAVIWLLERAGRPTVDSQMPLMLSQGMLLTDEQQHSRSYVCPHPY